MKGWDEECNGKQQSRKCKKEQTLKVLALSLDARFSSVTEQSLEHTRMVAMVAKRALLTIARRPGHLQEL